MNHPETQIRITAIAQSSDRKAFIWNHVQPVPDVSHTSFLFGYHPEFPQQEQRTISLPLSDGKSPIEESAFTDDLLNATPENIGLYLEQIGKIPLLTFQQEQDLAHRYRAGVQAGKTLARVAEQNQNISRAYRSSLSEQFRDGQEAKHTLITSNLRLVISIAKRYQGRGLPLIDLIQEGNVGLIRAINRFDPDRGLRLSTYATWWIRQVVTRSIGDQGNLIRMPIHLQEYMSGFFVHKGEIEHRLGREVTAEELFTMFPDRYTSKKQQKIRKALKTWQEPVSLDEPLTDDHTRGDFLPAEPTLFPEDDGDPSDSTQFINAVMEIFTPKEERIVRMLVLEGMTLEAVGKRYGLTRERMRQIKQKALALARHNRRIQRMYEQMTRKDEE